MSEVVWNEGALAQLLQSRGGAVASDLQRRGERVKLLAQSYASGQGGGPQVRTGRLRASIQVEAGQDAAGTFVDVRADAPYAPFVEEGTSRSRPRPFLRPGLDGAKG